MTKTEIEQIVIDLVCKIQELSGRAKTLVNAETRPVLDLPDFDSLNGVEVTVDLMDQFKTEFEFNNALVEDGNALTISQAATRLLNCVPKH